MSESISKKAVDVAENMEKVFLAGAIAGLDGFNPLQEALDAIIEIQETLSTNLENAEEVYF